MLFKWGGVKIVRQNLFDFSSAIILRSRKIQNAKARWIGIGPVAILTIGIFKDSKKLNGI